MGVGSFTPSRRRPIFEVEASENRYRNLIHFIPIPLWQVDARSSGQAFDELRAQGVVDIDAYLGAHPELIERAKDTVVVSEANDDAVRLFGASDRAELIRPVRYLFSATPGAARRVMVARFEGRRNYVEEMKVRTLDGRTRDVMFLVTFPAPNELLDTTLIIMLDITDRLEAEARLRTLEADFTHAARLATLGELATSIAHEVKQPLAAIVINADTSLRWLSRAEPNISEASELTSRIVSSAYLATDILQRVQNMAAKHETVRTPTDINEVVQEAVLLVRHECLDKAVSVALALEPRLPTVLGDRVQLQQVVVNLIVNSIQAIAQNDMPIRDIFLLTMFEAEQTICISIRDTGPGIADGDLARVFDSFFSTKKGGIGIGLSICKSIITAHGGSISASNHPDGGAVFRIFIPMETP